jgi:hypothetical protein
LLLNRLQADGSTSLITLLCCLSSCVRLSTDISQWGDIFNDLRNISSCSGQPPGLTTINSITTDWIPELLRERASGRLDPVAAAAAEGGSQPDAADGGKQQQQTAAGQAGAAGAAAAAGGDGDGEAADIVGDMCGGVRGRMGKRERSKTGQAPTAEQRQEWQVRQDAPASGSFTISMPRFV